MHGQPLVSSRVRKLVLTPIVALALFSTQGLAGVSSAFALPAPAAASKAQPNRFDPSSAAASILHRPQTSAAKSAPPPGPYTPPREISVPMQPARVPVDPVNGAHFVGSDGIFEFDVPAGAVSPVDMAAAGSSMSLLVRQVLPASGSSAGGSGHYSFGTYLVQLLDAAGRPAKQGFRKSVTFMLHHDKRAQALDVGHAHVLINPSIPAWFDTDPPAVLPAIGSPSIPSRTSAPFSPASASSGSSTSTASSARTSSAGAQSKTTMPTTKPATTSSTATATPTAPSSTSTAKLGPTSHQAAILDAANSTLSAVVALALASPTTGVSFDTDAPVATFGKPDPFNVGLSAGALTARYPIEVPAGPGGLTPPISLAYDSAAVSEQHNPQGAAPWVGEGWNLSLGSISWAEHEVQSLCQFTTGNCTNAVQWEDSWQLSDPFGTGADLVPPNINVSTYNDDTGQGITPMPLTWHTAPETRDKVISYTGPNSLPGSGVGNAPCFRVWLPSGIMEEFGCTSDSLQWYPQPTGANSGKAYIANWLLDLITDPNGNQVHVTYQQDMATGAGATTYPRDAVPATVEWDSPGCGNAQTACTGSSWAPLMRVNFVASHTPAHAVTTGVCAANGSLRCDDPVDLSGGGGIAAPAIQSTFVLNDLQVQVRSSGAAGWNTLRDYRLGYSQSGPSTITDPISGTPQSVAGALLMGQVQEIGSDGVTAMPATTLNYSNITSYYEDSLVLPNPSTNCGPSWNTGNGRGCVLWSQSYAGNSWYLTSVANGLGLAQTFSYQLARNNFEGVNGGGTNISNPFYCNNPSIAGAFPCNMPDNETWSRVVLTQKNNGVVRLTQAGQGGAQTPTTVSGTTAYTYQLTYPLSAQECANCQAGFYWGNQNDNDYLDFYNNRFAGFAQTAVSLPDGSVEIHKFFSTEGIGLYDVSTIQCQGQGSIGCHNGAFWETPNATHGHEYELDQYDTNGTTLLRQVRTRWAATCPPAGVGGTPFSPTYGAWAGNLVTELDHSNPTAVCEIRPSEIDRYTFDGSGGTSSHSATTYAYDALGRVSSETDVTNSGRTGVADGSGHGNSATVSGGVTEGVLGLVGDSDSAMSFDGNSGYVAGPALMPLQGNNTRSVEFWFSTTKTGSYTGQQNILDAGNPGVTGQSFTIGVTELNGVGGNSARTPGIYIGFWGDDVFLPNLSVRDGKPHHLVLTLIGTSMFFYVDGGTPQGQVWNGSSWTGMVNQPFTLPSAPSTPATPLWIGRTRANIWGAPGSYFDGLVDEVAIYDHVLNSARVQAHLTGGAGYQQAVITDTPTAYYRLDDGGPSVNASTILHKPQYVWNDSVSATATSASGTYIIDRQAFTDTEDLSANRYSCSYTSYDGQNFAMGQSGSLTRGLATTADQYTSCGSSPSFTPSGQIRTTHTYDSFGNQLTSNDPDANAGNTAHQGCTVSTATYSTCTTYDGTFGVLPTAQSNALSQTSSMGYQWPSEATSVGGFGLWPISRTDPNGQSTTTTYDALGRETSQALPTINTCPSGWSCADIGGPNPAGSQSQSNGTWTVQTGGWDIWGTADQFHFISQQQAGDGNISSRVVSQPTTDGWAKAGVMLRQSIDPGSAYYALEVTPANGIVVQYRASQGASAAWPVSITGAAPAYIQISRSGSNFSSYASTDGTTWTYIPGSSVTLGISGAMLAGLAVASHDGSTATTVTFDNVSVGNSVSPVCPSGWSCADIGNPTPAGGQNLSNGTWSLQAGGGDIWGTSDQFHFVDQSLAGDGNVSAQVVAQTNTDPWAKAGVMLRQSTDPASAYYAVEVTPSNGIVVQYRASAGAIAVGPTGVTATTPAYVRVSRSASTFSAYTSSDGINWTAVGGSTATLSVSGAMLGGLALTSHNTSLLGTVGVDNLNVTSGAPPPPTACPAGWTCNDIGGPTPGGSQSLANTSWTVQGGGGDIWGTSDQFHFLSQSMAGDGTIIARVASQTNTDPWAKAGVMIRQSSGPASAYYAVEITPGNGIVVQSRTSAGASAVWPAGLSGTTPTYVRVVRSGSTFSAATSGDGISWSYVPASTATLNVSGSMLAGFAVTSHNTSVLSTVTFDSVSLTSVPSVTTTATTYTVWCSGTSAQTPCAEVDKTQRLNSTTTVTHRAFYDGLGHLVETRSPAPSGQDMVRYGFYDPSQRLIFKSVPYLVSAYTGGPGAAAYSVPDSNQAGTSYTYDGLGRQTSATDALSKKTTTLRSVVCGPTGTADTACYEQTLTIDPNGHQRGTVVDPVGRRTYEQLYTGNSSSTYAVYATTNYSYDYAGDLIQILHPDGSTKTTYSYDMAGRKTGMTDPDRGNEAYVDDQNGNLIQSVDARGTAGTISMGYDGLNRPIWRNTTNSPTGAYDTYSYDSTAGGNIGVGRLTGETFSGAPNNSLSGSYSYSYDQRGRQIGNNLTVGSNSYGLQTTYDDASNVLTQTYPTGETVTSSYSAQGWLSGLSTAQSGVTTTLASGIAYTGTGGAYGEMTAVHMGGGYDYSASFDALDRPADLKVNRTTDGVTLFDQARTFDAAGNVLTASTTLAGGTDNQAFCYDEQDRLTWAGSIGTPPCTGTAIPAGTLTAAQYTQSFTYDTMGRLQTGPLGSYAYGDPAHVHAATAAGVSYTAGYDAAGDMTCRAPTAASTCGGTTPNGAQLTYNNEGELSGWQNAPTSPSATAAYLYDSHGERVLQQTTSAGVTTTTVYVGDVEEVTISGNTATTTTYYYANGKRIALAVGGTISYLASDALGSNTVTLNGSGNATASQLFAPYGGVRYSSGSMPTTFGFTGQRSDSVTGLDYYGARYFDPVAGQFTSADTVLPGDGLNILGLSRYAYVEGNPENRTDPSGHCFCDVPGSGDNFFPQSGGRLLNGESGDVFYGPGYTQMYHLDWSGYHPHHYQPLRARASSRRAAPRGPARGESRPTPAGADRRPAQSSGDSSDRYGHFLNPNPLGAGLNNQAVELDLTYQTLEFVSFIPYTQYWVSWELQRHVVRPATERGVWPLLPLRGLLGLSQRVGLSGDEVIDNLKSPIEHRLGLGYEPEGDEGKIGHIGPHQTGPVRYLPGEHPDGSEDIVW